MRKTFNKKACKRLLSIIVVCCVLITGVGLHSLTVQAADEVTANGIPFNGNGTIPRTPIGDDGMKATYSQDLNGFDNSIFIRKVEDARKANGKGLHIEIEDITFPNEKDYSICVSFLRGGTTASTPGGYGDVAGQMLVYGKDGKCVIYDTRTGNAPGVEQMKYRAEYDPFDVNTETNMVNGKLSLDITRVGSYFEITINEHDTIQVEAHSAIEEGNFLGFRFALMGAVKNDYTVNWSETIAKDSSFVVKGYENAVKNVADTVAFKGNELFGYTDVEEGVKVTYNDQANPSRNYTVYEIPCYNLAKGVHVELQNISLPSKDLSNTSYTHSMAIGIVPPDNNTGSAGNWMTSDTCILAFGADGKCCVYNSPSNDTEMKAKDLSKRVDFNYAMTDNRLSLDIIQVDGKVQIDLNNGSAPIEISSIWETNQIVGFRFAIFGTVVSSEVVSGKGIVSGGSFVISEISSDNLVVLAYDNTTFGNYRSGTYMRAPEKKGYVFAGWYYDHYCTEPVAKDTKTVSEETKVYAKFLPEAVLDVKAQINGETTANSEKTDMRFVATVDSKNYEKVGFAITSSSKQMKRYFEYMSYTNLKAGNKTYVASDFSGCSKSFVTMKMSNISVNENTLEMPITVQAFWVTLDGTTVYGETSVKTIQAGIDAIAAQGTAN